MRQRVESKLQRILEKGGGKMAVRSRMLATKCLPKEEKEKEVFKKSAIRRAAYSNYCDCLKKGRIGIIEGTCRYQRFHFDNWRTVGTCWSRSDFEISFVSIKKVRISLS